MRYLTIKRRKNLFRSMVKMKVYIEDPVYGDTRINGCKCSKLGVLKNGEEATFTIENDELKVFAIMDKSSRNQFNDFRTIPAGDEDVYLSGVVDHGVFSGNPFLFDGDGCKEVQANRKRVKRNGVIAVIVAFIVAIIFSVGQNLFEHYLENRPEDFSAEGMTITLTNDFEPVELPDAGFAATYANEDIAVFVRKEAFSLADGIENLSLEEYGAIMIQLSPQAGDAQVQTGGDIPYIEYTYTNPETGIDYNYHICLYKSDDAFWSLQFATKLEDVQRLYPDIQKWSASVRFE